MLNFRCSRIDKLISLNFLILKTIIEVVREEKIKMRISKLVAGICLNVLALWLLIDGVVNGFMGVWANQNIVSGVLEIILAGLFIGAGIVYIALENSDGLGGDITGFVLLILGGIIGIIGGFYNKWMFLYAVISLIFGIGFFVWHLRER